MTTLVLMSGNCALFLVKSKSGLSENSPSGCGDLETEENPARFTPSDRHVRESNAGTIITIWIKCEFKPERVGLIFGETDLLPGMGLLRNWTHQ